MDNQIVGKCPLCNGNMVIGYIYKHSATAYSPMCESCGYMGFTEDYEGRCGNCHQKISGDDMYCRYCGTKRGEGSFKPYRNVIFPLYGPIEKRRIHKCKKCGQVWKSYSRFGESEKYCTNCGAACEISEDVKENIKALYNEWIDDIDKRDCSSAVKRFYKYRVKERFKAEYGENFEE